MNTLKISFLFCIIMCVVITGCAQKTAPRKIPTNTVATAPTTQQAVSSVSQTVSSSPQSFPLGPEDILEISVWKDEALTRQTVVRPDGKVSFPLIGDIQASGKTVDQLRQDIQEQIAEYVPDAPVSINVLKIESPKVYIVGKVNRPGTYVMGHPMTVMQALALAGGLTAFASNNIQIQRTTGTGQKTFHFNYGKVSAGKNLDTNIILQPHDTIIVP